MIDVSHLGALARWLVMTLALTYVITQSAIFSFVRRGIARMHPMLATLVYCPACTGFWAGGAAALFLGCVRGGDAFAAALAGMVLGALWQRWGPEVDVWKAEQDGSTTAAKGENDG